MKAIDIFFVSDREHPYIQEKPFYWIRGYQVGGRSLTWYRQCYRWSDLDFEANARDGIGIDWPIRYRDIAPWYDYVERFVGISGKAEGLSHLPDGIFLPPMDINCVEDAFKEALGKFFPDRVVTIGRCANLTRSVNGRSPCQYRNLCSRGCPNGAYFSSNSATIPAAMSTGRLTLLPHSIVTQVLLDKHERKAVGVRVIDANTMQTYEYFARVIFLNASTIATTAILLSSRSAMFPDGLGNNYGQLGRYLMDHHSNVGAVGEWEGGLDRYYFGRRPNGIYVPRFRNIDEKSRRRDYVRGFGYQGFGERENWSDIGKRVQDFGLDLKEALIAPGRWKLMLNAFGEALPYPKNRVTLEPTQRDKWGQPLVRIDFEFKDNERVMRKDMRESAEEMLTKAGFKNVRGLDGGAAKANSIHEMGTARMGHDLATSVLNKWNQLHDVKNVFVTDGSCMTSSACQNPSLTYMALTARACDYAVGELKALNL